jgi:hypothetical protein
VAIPLGTKLGLNGTSNFRAIHWRRTEANVDSAERGPVEPTSRRECDVELGLLGDLPSNRSIFSMRAGLIHPAEGRMSFQDKKLGDATEQRQPGQIQDPRS